MAEVETAQSQQADVPRETGAARPSEAEAGAVGPLAEAISIMARLRAPGGCPWDREQTFDTIKRHTLEETYEVFDAIERRAWPDLEDELGDLLLQVLFYAQMASEEGYFDIFDVAANLNAKLVRRHPHVFPVEGKLADATDAEAVLRNWDEIKRGEKRAASVLKNEAATLRNAEADARGASALDAVPRSMPAVMEAGKLGSKAARAGFDWPDVEGLFEKLQEEIDELTAELEKVEAAELGRKEEKKQARVEEELGDLLFTAVNLARHLKVDAESALRAANAKFRARFRAMEANAGGFDALAALSPAELDALWNRAKRGTNAKSERSAGSEPVPIGPSGLKI
jgi:XTP/dITP diphosphohydrolase/ATP diphosphatase